jgi:hypothetical protein
MRGINVESTHHSGGDPMRWRLVPKDEAKAMSDRLNNFINSLFHRHGQTRVCSLDKVVLTRVRLMVGTLNLIVGMNMTLLNASLTAAVVFGRGNGRHDKFASGLGSTKEMAIHLQDGFYSGRARFSLEAQP